MYEYIKNHIHVAIYHLAGKALFCVHRISYLHCHFVPFPLGPVVMFLSSYCAPDRVSLTFFGYLVCPFSDPVHHQLLSYEDIRVEGTLITTIYI